MQIALTHVVSSTGMTYVNVISVPTKEHNRYMIYITTYSPSGTRAFNAARTVLHTLREHIHVLKEETTRHP
jgi:2-keto-3-deoxy-L-rhamnonate aldolase RhmA